MIRFSSGLIRPGKARAIAQAACLGLPLADVLSADTTVQALAERDALFASDAIFPTPVVLWAFLAQALRHGKGAP